MADWSLDPFSARQHAQSAFFDIGHTDAGFAGGAGSDGHTHCTAAQLIWLMSKTLASSTRAKVLTVS